MPAPSLPLDYRSRPTLTPLHQHHHHHITHTTAFETLRRHSHRAKDLADASPTLSPAAVIDDLPFPGTGRRPLLSDEDTCILSMYLAQRNAIGQGMNREQVRGLLADLAEKKGFEAPCGRPFTASQPYIRHLLKRTHTVPGAVPLDASAGKALSIPRAKAREPSVIKDFADMAMKVFAKVKQTDAWDGDTPPPEICFNVDEIG